MCDIGISSLRRPRSELGCVWLGLVHILTFHFSASGVLYFLVVVRTSQQGVIHKDNINLFPFCLICTSCNFLYADVQKFRKPNIN